MKRIIPKNKIADQRMGQLIFNAMKHAGLWEHTLNNAGDSVIIQERDLFYIENNKLEKIIQNFIKYYNSPSKSSVKKKTKTGG